MKQYLTITKTDALSFLLFIIPIVLIGMGVAPFFLGDITFQRSFGRTGTLTTEGSSFYFSLTIMLLPIALFFYIYRLRFIKDIVNNGKSIQGTVIDIQFTKDKGFVIYEYRIGDMTYKTTNRIMKSKSTQALNMGNKVTICYDSRNSRKAFIKEIYI